MARSIAPTIAPTSADRAREWGFRLGVGATLALAASLVVLHSLGFDSIAQLI